jgi:hypothetical protein
MIKKEKLNQLIKASLTGAGQQLADADIESHIVNITPKLEQIIGYPDWDVRDDTQADIDFINLEPTFGKPWRDWVHEKAGIDLVYLAKIEAKLDKLNNEIATDNRLGIQFQVGHSYVTPAFDSDIKDAANWFT